MQVREIPIAEISPYEDNPRLNDSAVEVVANSLREFGWRQPIVIDENNTIVAGHTRYKAALSLGMVKVPVVDTEGLTAAQVKAYRLADNKTGELAVWDFGLLDSELEALSELDFDMGQFGFAGIEFSALDDFLENDFTDNSSITNGGTFYVSFTFPNSAKEKVERYIKEFGKDEISNLIVSEAEQWG